MSSTATTVQRGPRYRNGFYVPVSSPALDSVRESSRRTYRDGFPRVGKAYAIDKNRLTAGKKDGGTLASLKCEMLASDEFARLVAADVQAFADAITRTSELCFFRVSCEGQKDDGDEDEAQMRVLAEPTIENIDDYIAKAKRDRAALDKNIAAAEQLKQKMLEKGA